MSDRLGFSRVSVVLPAKNEAVAIGTMVRRIVKTCPGAEIIVIDDGSVDTTGREAVAAGAKVIRHSYSKGNGAAIKTGARAASGDILVFMDGDGQHRPEDIPCLLAKLDGGHDMVVGARDASGQASRHRGLANAFYNRLASWMVGQRIADLTSGFRAARRACFNKFLYLLPNGFSYPTTCTMVFFRAGYSVGYEPIAVQKRTSGSKSHVQIWRDGLRFLLIIFKIGTLYSPLKIFGPVAALMFLLATGWYGHTFLAEGRFTNMSLLLYTGGVMVFLMGLISEQITALMYRDSD